MNEREQSLDFHTPRIDNMRFTYANAARQIRNSLLTIQVGDFLFASSEFREIKEEALQVIPLIDTARKGYILHLKAKGFDTTTIKDLVDHTKLKKFDNPIKIDRPEKYTDAWEHLKTTRSVLNYLKDFTFDDLADPIDNLNLGIVDETYSTWQPLSSPDDWFNFFSKLENTTFQTINNPYSIRDIGGVLPAGHFFTVASIT